MMPEIFLSLPLKRARALFEREYLEHQIRRWGNKTNAAIYSGIQRAHINGKLAKETTLGAAVKS